MKKLVLWSTPQSIVAEIPSVAAIVETIAAVILYWWLAFRFDTYLALLLGATVAPLVLLRSDPSVALGVKWFGRWQRDIWLPTSPEEQNWKRSNLAGFGGPLPSWAEICGGLKIPNYSDGIYWEVSGPRQILYSPS